MMDLLALADGDAVLMHRTKLHNTFTCQPQQRNMHGLVFGFPHEARSLNP